MDPMEDVQMNGQSNSAYQHQCRQPHMPSASPSFTPQARDSQRYDPVHESETWIRNNRPSYPPAQSAPHWQPSSYMPVPHWQNYGEPQRTALQSSDSPGFRASRGFMDMPWNEMRSFDTSFGYSNPYTGPFGSSGASDPANGPGNSQAPPSAMPPQFTNYNGPPGHPDIWHRTQSHYGRPPPLTPLSQRRNEEISTERAARHHQPTPPSERQRYANSVARRAYRAAGLNDSWASASARRLAMQLSTEGQSDEEEEEEEEVAAAMEANAFRRETEFILQSENEGRNLAVMRAALASGKKVTTKDYIQKLESVPLDQIPESERNCSICYETIGTENPEGLKEKAVRLPKCRHIFGDICIKKWIGEQDTCPYCRDKLPSEINVKKSAISDYRAVSEYRAQRMRVLNRRQAYAPESDSSYESASLGPLFSGLGPNRTYEPASPQRRDEYLRARGTRGVSDDLDSPLDAYLAEPWGSSSQSNRPYPAENADRPSERRRTTRGQPRTSRAPHLQSRPTSVGSARFITSAANHQNASQRAHVLNHIPPSISGFGGHLPPRRSITPGLARQNSNSAPAGNRSSATQELLSALEVESRAQEASPPVAIGSGERSWDLFAATAPRSDEWDTFGSPPRHSAADAVASTLGSPFQEVLRSPHRQHPTSEGNNSSTHIDEENFTSGPLFGDSSNLSSGTRWSR